MHRDLKPSNILIDDQCRIKICDFGLARTVIESNKSDFTTNALVGIRSTGDKHDVLSPRMQSRWFRAPEILLVQPNYSNQIDIWSLGCISFEICAFRSDTINPFKRNTLFRGTSSEVFSPCSDENEEDPTEQMLVIINSISSSENIKYWSKDAQKYLQKKEEQVSNFYPLEDKLDDVIENEEFKDLIMCMLKFTPNERIPAKQLLIHPIFDEIRNEKNESPPDTKVIIDETTDNY